MQTTLAPIAKELVLLGGGHAHALVLCMWGMNPLPGVRLTLISNSAYAPYSGMLPGYLAGQYSFQDIHIDLRQLCNFAGARFILAEAEGLDLERKTVHLPERPPLRFDLLSLDTGSQPGVSALPGAREHAIPLKPIPCFLSRFDTLVREHQETKQKKRVAIIGAGAGGVELALAIQTRFPTWEIRLLHKGAEVLPGSNEKSRQLAHTLLKERGILLTLSQEVNRIHANCVETTSGDFFPAEEIFLVTQAEAPAWAKTSGLAVDERGFVLVHPTLQSSSHQDVFAAGDLASVVGFSRPKAGVFAVRQGRPLFENLRRALREKPLREFHPQEKFLTLLNSSSGEAIAARGDYAYRSPLMWMLKDFIDRRFMKRFQALRPRILAEEPLPGSERLFEESKLRCLGCAAKVGGDVLENVFRRLREEGKLKETCDEVVIGLDRPDDAAILKIPVGHQLVQTLDYLPALISDPWLFGRVAVNHAVSDIYAMGASPMSMLALVLLPFAREKLLEEELYQLLSGVLTQASLERTPLIGGHTAEGPQALGFVCNGLLGEGVSAFTKSALRPGDTLITTKALGVGTIFAAEMRGEGMATWVDTALASMLLSNREAARVFRENGVRSCTDITGFGLAGHLLEMLRASSRQAVLRLSEIPNLPGARESFEKGIQSSLQTRNRSVSEEIEVDPDLKQSARIQLLFDPQTSGGLLAGVEPSRVEVCLRSLREAGYKDARVIGEVLPESNRNSASEKRLRVEP